MTPQTSRSRTTRFDRLIRNFAVLILGAAAITQAGTLTGSVENGTSNRPLTGAEVVLMELQQGMTPVSKVKTDSQGRFRFHDVELGKGPMLLEVSYHGVPYYQTTSSGDRTASIVVYETSATTENIAVSSHSIVLRPNGSNLQVEEQYVVDNRSRPPVAFYKQGGTFGFPVPDDAQIGEVFAWTASNIPTRQERIDMANGLKAIHWPFRPGKSIVRIFYAVPYPSNKVTLRSRSPYQATHFFLVAPPGIHISSDGFSRVGSEQGFDVYARQAVGADTPVAISISGVPAGQPTANGENASVSSGETAVSTVPAPYRKLLWIVGGTFAVLLVVGTLLFSRGAAAEPKATSEKAKRNAPSSKPMAADFDENLDRVTLELVELNGDRKRGAITEDAYARERERAKQTLREILRD